MSKFPGLEYWWLRGIVLFLAALGGAWFSLSVATILNMQADEFQRLGSFGVAVTVAAYGVTRHIYGYVSALFDAAMKKRLFDKARDARDFIDRTGHKDISHLEEAEHASILEFRKLYLTLDSVANAEMKVKRGLRLYVSLEIFILVIATLQWGYGDLFVCLLHGEGWNTC